MIICYSTKSTLIQTLSDMWLFCFPRHWGSGVDLGLHLGSPVTKVMEYGVVGKASASVGDKWRKLLCVWLLYMFGFKTEE